jgi:hypothetical protein
VSTSTAISASASNASGEQKLGAPGIDVADRAGRLRS